MGDKQPRDKDRDPHIMKNCYKFRVEFAIPHLVVATSHTLPQLTCHSLGDAEHVSTGLTNRKLINCIYIFFTFTNIFL